MTDDEPTGNITTGRSVAVGSSVTGVIETEGDVDFFAVRLEAGVTYQIDLEGTNTGGGSLQDPLLTGIFNDNGGRVAFQNDDGGVGINSRITFTPSETGTFFIGASSFNNVNLTDVGSYTLFVEVAELSTRPDPVTIRRVGSSGDDLIDGISFGFAYGDGVNTPNLSFSFADSNSTFTSPFNLELDDDETIDITQFVDRLSPVSEAIFRSGLAQAEGFANLNFTEVADEGNTFGTIRIFDNDAASGRVIGLAGLPGNSVTASDIAIFEGAIRDPDLLSFVILHELGHALGLEHPEEEGSVFPEAFAGAEFTVLVESFTSAFFPSAVRASFYPTTFSYADILTLRHLYGPPPTPENINDTYRFDLNAEYWQTIFDTEGTDTIEVFGSNESVTIDLSPNDEFFGGAFIDVGTTVRYFASNGSQVGTRDATVFVSPETIIENLTAAGGNDTLVGNAVANVIRGGDGNDSIDGAAGADRLLAEAGNDLIIGGSGGDTIVGGTGNDTGSGGDGNDIFFAGSGDSGADFLVGDGDNDLLAGGAGDDLLVGGYFVGTGFSFGTSNASATAGSDTLFGGAGDDTLIGGNFTDTNNNRSFSAGEASLTDASGNTLFAGTGNDQVFGSGGDDVLGGGTGSDTITGGGGSDTVFGGRSDESTLGTNDVINTGDGNDLIFASGGNDRIDGGNGADTIFGGAQNDTINGGDGADDIFNGAGNDSVDAGNGNDIIRTGTGNDTLTGGSGSDQFIFASGHGDDRITDFNIAADSLLLAATVTDFTSLSDIEAASSDATIGGTAGLLIDTGGGDSIFLVGLSVATISSLSIIFD